MRYDYIFCGFGLSTLLLLEELHSQKLLTEKNILILEMQTSFREQTWCFWEQGSGKWDNLLSGQWHSGIFKDETTSKEILGRLSYKSIDAKTLRNYVTDLLVPYSCDFKNEEVLDWSDRGNEVSVQTSHQTYIARYFFNSAYQQANESLQSPVLLQHFVGWFVECAADVFNPDQAIIMDFSVPQNGNTRFMYVLPFSKNTALVEYTLFSPALIPPAEYGAAIQDYLHQQGIADYQVTKKEKGVIPMTCHPFWKKNTKNVLHIGTGGGWTKASSGYTFTNASKFSRSIGQLLKQDKADFRHFHQANRFGWYDRLFIDVLYNENWVGKRLFRSLFMRTKSDDVMRFLNEESTLTQDMGIIWACPKLPFLRALINVVFKK